jgi:hypothetical protein
MAQIYVKGILTDEGVECQALRSDDNQLYTLVGDLNGFTVGDTVYVLGTTVDISICMQGVTIKIESITSTPPKAKMKSRRPKRT